MFNSKYLFAAAAVSALMVPAFVVSVDAANTMSIEDGTYEVNFLAYKTGTTETSGMAGRFAQPGKLIVENGEARLELKIMTQNSMMGMLTIPYKGVATQMTVLDGDASSETRTISLPIDTFNKTITVDVDVVFPVAAKPVRQTFDLIVESPNESSLAEEVAITVYKYGSVDASAMQQFIQPLAKVQLEQEFAIVQFTITAKQFVQNVTVNGQQAKVVAEEGTNATYEVQIQDPKQLLEAEIALNYGTGEKIEKAHLHLAVKGEPIMIHNPFTDMENHESKQAALNLLSKGIIKANDKFNPSKPLTRSQFALMLARTLNLSEAADAGFKDIATLKSTDVERYNAINALQKAGIVVKAEQFKPNDTITRQQAALMIYRAMQYHVGTSELDFGNNISVYADAAKVKNEEAQLAFSFLYASNAMTGNVQADGSRVINPQTNLTRGQMAKVLNGTLKYMGH